jgi:hypothetical protein
MQRLKGLRGGVWACGCARRPGETVRPGGARAAMRFGECDVDVTDFAWS